MKCNRCGKENPAEIHTCTPNQTHDEALLRQALEALRLSAEGGPTKIRMDAAIAALRERLGEAT